jgi:hypothetical protein
MDPTTIQIGLAFLAIIIAVAAWLWPRPAPVPDGETPSLRARLRARLRPQELAILPVSFEIKLNQPKPEVRVTAYAVNYLWRDVTLDEVRVEYFQLSRGQSVENLTVTNLPVPGRQQRLITCRRVLAESEVQLFLGVPNEDRYHASMRVSAMGRARWGKRVRFDHLLNYNIEGWLERP